MKHEKQIDAYRSLPNQGKVYFLLALANSLTIVLRSISTNHTENETGKAAHVASELQGKLVGEAMAKLSGEEHYPDHILISMTIDQLDHESLFGEGPIAWEMAIKRLAQTGDQLQQTALNR